MAVKSSLKVSVNSADASIGSIDPNLVVNITTEVAQVPQGAGILALTGLTTNTLIPNSMLVKQFNSSIDVGNFFGINSDEYKQSLIYFKGTDQSAGLPPYMYFARYNAVAQSAYIRSQSFSNTTTLLANIVALGSTNTFTFLNGATLITASNVAFGSATSLSQVATLLQTAIQTSLATATVTWDAVLNQFTLSNGVTGATSVLAFNSAQAVGSTNDVLGLSASTNAYVSNGNDAQTPAQNMNLLVDYLYDTANIYPVSNLGDTTTATYLGLANWISSVGNNRYALLLPDASVAETQSPDTTSLQALITNANYNNTAVFYNNVNLCILAGSIFASADYTQVNSALTACFKSQQGITPTVTSTNIAKVLLAKGTNFYGNYGLATASYNFLQAGNISGAYKFIDNLMGAIWIARNIQLNIFNLFTAVGEVVNSNVGYNQIYNQIVNVLNANIINGVIAQGQDLSAYAQEIQSKYNINVNVISNNGWYIISTPSTALQRQARTTPTWIVLYVKGNAVQELPITIVGLN